MRKVTVHVAKTQLSRLIEAALAGEEVVIAKGDKPVVRLVPIPQGQFRFGVLPAGALGEGPDFFTPMDENELHSWEGRS
ncbi:MAG TPA: type II toxin-antitoxin system Phd/YefM family antitoxin [Roseiarcus sp.]|jgi:antitoxin (DNA-binding transcriptional repressor) of toxin-antitoxin stability system|nr:type II toxin-antitoxin system Phd/YefM family antitoxin [Roseiarcus sp.]